MKELSVSARIKKITKILNDIKIDMKPNSVMCLMIEKLFDDDINLWQKLFFPSYILELLFKMWDYEMAFDGQYP